MRGREKKRNHIILVVIAVLTGIRLWVGYGFGVQVYRFGVFFVGMLAGIAALIVAKTLIDQKPGDEDEDKAIGDTKEQIQLLKLN